MVYYQVCGLNLCTTVANANLGEGMLLIQEPRCKRLLLMAIHDGAYEYVRKLLLSRQLVTQVKKTNMVCTKLPQWLVGQ